MLVETSWLESYRNQYFVKYRVGGCKVIESCRYGNGWNLMRGRCSQKYAEFEMLQSRRAKLLAELFRTQECQYGWDHQWLMSLCCSFKGGPTFSPLGLHICATPRTGAMFCRWNSFPSSSLELRQARRGRFANQCGSSSGGWGCGF